MAEVEQDRLPNFENLSAGLNILSTELPRMRNSQGVALGQQILDRLTGIENSIVGIENSIVDLSIITEDRFLSIEDRLLDVDNRLLDVNNRLLNIENRLDTTTICEKNARIKSANAHHLAVQRNAALLPLLDIQSGVAIPNCPATSADIHTLTAADATRILQALRIPIPGTLAEKQEAVRLEFY